MELKCYTSKSVNPHLILLIVPNGIEMELVQKGKKYEQTVNRTKWN